MNISVQLRAQLLDPPDKYADHGLADAHVVGVGMDAFGFGRGVDLAQWIEDTKDARWIEVRLDQWAYENGDVDLERIVDALLLDWEKELRIIGSTREVRAAIGRCVAAARDFFGSGVKMIGYGLPGPPGPRGNLPPVDDQTLFWVGETFDAVAAVGYCQSNWVESVGTVPVSEMADDAWLHAVGPNAETSLTYAKQFGLPVYWMLWHRFDGIPRADGKRAPWQGQPFLLDVDPDLSRTWAMQVAAAVDHGAHEVLLWNPEDEPALAEAIGVIWPSDDDDTDVIEPPDGLDERVRRLESLHALMGSEMADQNKRLTALENGQRKQSSALARHERRLSALEASNRSLVQRVRERWGRGERGK